MPRILLVEDAVDTQYLVTAVLGASHRVIASSTLAEARDQLMHGKFDLILLDVTLPDGDGFKFCSEIKSDAKTRDVPVLFLTGRSDIADKEMGFSLGADDYLAKPFDPRELRARVEARLRRAQNAEQREESLRKGDLVMHTGLQKAFVMGGGRETQLDLTPLEFRLLLFFFKHEEQVFSREQLISKVWNDNLHVLDRTVDAHISNLRRKIAGSGYTIKSIYGVGYSFMRMKAREAASYSALSGGFAAPKMKSESVPSGEL